MSLEYAPVPDMRDERSRAELANTLLDKDPAEAARIIRTYYHRAEEHLMLIIGELDLTCGKRERPDFLNQVLDFLLDVL